MNDNDKSFLDGNTLLAIGLSIFFFIGWQYYINKKYPDANKPKEVVEKSLEKGAASTPTTLGTSGDEEALQEQPENQVVTNENIIAFDGPTFKLEISNKGMGFKNIYLTNFSDRKEQAIGFATKIDPGTLKEGQDPNSPQYADIAIGNFATLYNGKPIDFNIRKVSDTEYFGEGTFPAGTVEKSVVFDANSYLAKINVKIKWSSETTLPIETYIVDRAMVAESSSMFVPSYEGSRIFAISDGSEEREMIDPEKGASYSYEKVSLVAVDSQYFSLSFLDESAIVPRTTIQYDPTNKIVAAKVLHSSTGNGPMEINFKGFMGPKQNDLLTRIDDKMPQLIDYGIFSVLSRPILSLLQTIYGLINNWGIAIILLTICIRLLLLPINVSSYKSMQKMQKIQPLLKQVKEKYKDDPQKINQETMLIMKREKANPLGGCLPMLLQIPVFFALFTVLGQSIELYKSPFAFWIQDLSYKDPYFVMPVVVGALYFLQMQLTPTTTMDPTQARIMKMIPLIFVFFMFSMPSGLTLYFAVNTIFGIGQQYIFQREKRKAAAA